MESKSKSITILSTEEHADWLLATIEMNSRCAGMAMAEGRYDDYHNHIDLSRKAEARLMRLVGELVRK